MCKLSGQINSSMYLLIKVCGIVQIKVMRFAKEQLIKQ